MCVSGKLVPLIRNLGPLIIIIIIIIIIIRESPWNIPLRISHNPFRYEEEYSKGTLFRHYSFALHSFH